MVKSDLSPAASVIRPARVATSTNLAWMSGHSLRMVYIRPMLSIALIHTIPLRILAGEKNYGKHYHGPCAVLVVCPRASIKENAGLSLQTQVKSTDTNVGLTTFAEVAPELKQTESNPLGPLPALQNPYIPQDLKDVLSRKYRIKSMAWTKDNYTETDLGYVHFPGDLLAIANVQDKLSNFAWIASDYTVEVRLTTSPLHVGTVIISEIHGANLGSPVDNDRNASIFQKSQNKARQMHANTDHSLTFDVSREVNYLADDTDPNSAYSLDGDNALLKFTVLNKLILGGSSELPTPLQIEVYASFKNPVVSGYGYVPIAAARAKRLVKQAILDQQSGGDPISSEAFAKATKGVLSSSLDAKTNMKTILSASPFPDFTPILDMAHGIEAFTASLGFAKPNTVAAAVPTYDDRYGSSNYTHGVAYGTKFSLHPEAKLAKAVVAGFCKHTLQQLMLRPTLLHTFIFTEATTPNVPLVSWHSDPSLCPNVFENPDYRYYPSWAAYLSQFFAYYRGSMKYLFQFVTSQFVTAKVRITHSPVNAYATNVEENSGDATSIVVDVSGTLAVQRVVPMQNPQGYAPTVGYHAIDDAGEATLIDPIDANTWVMMSLVDPLVQPTLAASATIYCNIWVSAAEDMVLKDFLGYDPRRTAAFVPPPEEKLTRRERALAILAKNSERKELTKQSMDEIFAKPFDGIIPAVATMEAGLISTEHASTIEELCTRMRQCSPSAAYSDIWDDGPFEDFYQGDHFSTIAQNFRMYRGATRWRVQRPTNYDGTMYIGLSGYYTPNDPAMYPAGTRIIGPNAVIDTMTSFTTEFESPWSWTTFGREIGVGQAPRMGDGSKATYIRCYTTESQTFVVPVAIWRAAGDDLEFSNPLPPTTLRAIAPPASKGKEKVNPKIHNEESAQELLKYLK